MSNLLASNQQAVQKLLELFDIGYLLSSDEKFQQEVSKFTDAKKLEDYVLTKANKMIHKQYQVREPSTIEALCNMIISSKKYNYFVLPLTNRVIEIV